ncbi:MAG: glycosyltransferase [Bacillota bacterium]
MAISPTVAAHYKLLGFGSDARVYVETALSPQVVDATPGNSQAGEPILLSVGRLVEYKGHSFLIQAVHKLVRQEGLRAQLLIVGDGPLRHELQDLVTALGLGNWVHLIRHVPQGPELWQHYRSASIYVQPSLTESFGMAVLEGMYFGLPVVASRVGGLRDIVQHGETGILVPPGDVEALSSALATLLRSPDLRQRMGSAGRAVALRYTPEGETETLLRVLTKVVKRRQIQEAAGSRAGSGG